MKKTMIKRLMIACITIGVAVGGFFLFQMRPPEHDVTLEKKTLQLIADNKLIDFNKLVRKNFNTIIIVEDHPIGWTEINDGRYYYNDLNIKVRDDKQYVLFTSDDRIQSYIEIPKKQTNEDIEHIFIFEKDKSEFYGSDGKFHFKDVF
ncbi:MAG: hypothetical protein ACRCWQ_08765 [Bacilli bacterium]